MRAVIQRITNGSVQIDHSIIANQTGPGLMVFLGIGKNDDEEIASQFAKKIANLRIFSDDQGKMNISVLDVKGYAIVVSQFTLYADTKRGNRPSFIEAGEPGKARDLIDFFAKKLQSFGIETSQGEFAGDMKVTLTNDGPVTIWIEI